MKFLSTWQIFAEHPLCVRNSWKIANLVSPAALDRVHSLARCLQGSWPEEAPTPRPGLNNRAMCLFGPGTARGLLPGRGLSHLIWKMGANCPVAPRVGVMSDKGKL